MDKLQQALYTGSSIPDVLEIYEQSLKDSKTFTDIAHASKINEYRNLITNKKFLSRIRKNFNEIYSLLDQEFPDVCFVIDGRRKSLISTEKKIRKLLRENKSLDLLRDLFAFRILIFGKDSQKLISLCYSIAKRIIQFSVEKGLTLCEADKVIGTEQFDISSHPNIIIPKKSQIPDIYQYGVKDYIYNPKANGYQSLHITFRANTGEFFEIQIRTFDMHVHAESGDALHSVYKTKKYPNEIKFDKNSISIPGYGISPSGDVFDFVGLEQGLEILKRQKTYGLWISPAKSNCLGGCFLLQFII